MQFSLGFQQMLELYRSISNYKYRPEYISHYSTSNTNRVAIMVSRAKYPTQFYWTAFTYNGIKYKYGKYTLLYNTMEYLKMVELMTFVQFIDSRSVIHLEY